MNGLLEILTNKHWMISPDYLHGVRHTIQGNLNGHVAIPARQQRIGARISIGAAGFPADVQAERFSADDGHRIDGGDPQDRDKPFINLLFVDGPVTRNGGACSYGSRDYRDLMMAAADSPNCVGHIFLINTPGGSAWAKNDFRQAIDYARERGQEVDAVIDGLCASAGMYLAALCDHRYYINPKDEIGCIGVLAAFYTEADGSVNKYTNETYHEIYDPESFDKNRSFRDIANDGDDKLMIEELARLGVEFRATVQEACPNATDEHLHGKLFAAEDVEGILVDRQATLGDVFGYVIAAGVKNGLDAAVRAQQVIRPAAENNNTNTNINMKETYPAIFALLGVEEMQMSEEGTFFNAELLGTLNGALEAKAAELAEAKAQAEQLGQEKQELENRLAEKDGAMEQLNADHAAAVETLNAEHAQAVEALNTGHAQAVEALNAEHAAALAGRDATIAERDQQIADLNAQIEEMQREPGAAEGLEGPADNGAGAEAPTVEVGTVYVYDNAKSYEENMAAKKAWNREHGM